MAYQNIIVFDTETTGLPNLKSVELSEQPHIVQFSYIVYNIPTQSISKLVDEIIKIPENIIIPDFCTNLHKIDQIICQSKGKEIDSVLNEFYEDLLNCDLCVAHNIKFDNFMMRTELKRIKEQMVDCNKIQEIERKLRYLKRCDKFYCTMMNSVNICNVYFPSPSTRLKFPKLIELYTHYFDNITNNKIQLHNSLYDVYICLRCFIKLQYNHDLCIDLLHELYFL
jgi:DNA polymerase III epsilon subunit-like protein